MITDLWCSILSKSSAIVVCVICFGVPAPIAEARQVEVGFVSPRAVFEWRRLSAEWHFKPDASARAGFRGPYGGSVSVSPDGRAVINLLVPGTLRVEVTPAAALDVRGKAEITVTPEQFNSAEQVVLTVPLEAVERATLLVTLRDARNGRFLVNQKVSLSDLRGNRPASYATSDQMGRAKLSAELGGTYCLRLETNVLGHMPSRDLSTTDLRRGQLLWSVAPPVAVLAGRIVMRGADNTESPPTGLGPSALLLWNDQGRSYRLCNGREDFAFVAYDGDIPPGTYDLKLDTDRLRRFELVEPKRLTVPAVANVDADAKVTVVVRPRPQCDVTIRLRSAGPKSGPVNVHLGNTFYASTVETEAPGEAVFPGVPSGSYTVSIRSPVFQDVVRRPLEVAKQGQVHEFELVQSFVYTASVLREGVPATDVWLFLREVREGEKRLRHVNAKQKNESGPWHCVDLNPGPHMVYVMGKKTDNLVYVSETFEMHGDVTQTIHLPPTISLSGTARGLERIPRDKPKERIHPFPLPRQFPRQLPRQRPMGLVLLLETPNGLTAWTGAASAKMTPEANTYAFALLPGRYRAYVCADENAYFLGEFTLGASDGPAQKDFEISADIVSRPTPVKDLAALDGNLRERQPE